MKIYIDIGNTNIKINFIEGDESSYVSYPTKIMHTVDTLYNSLPITVKDSKIEDIWICSVVPRITKVVIGVSKKYFNKIPRIIEKGIKTGVKLQIDNPKSLGSDLVSLAAYANTISNNTIIVNMGTATTIIHVKDSILKGVIIMSGVENQLSGLVNNAAKISEMIISYKEKILGKNTEDALSIGIINSHIYAINHHIELIDKNAIVILSGGNRKYIGKYANFNSIKEATIEGMKVIEELNGG